MFSFMLGLEWNKRSSRGLSMFRNFIFLMKIFLDVGRKLFFSLSCVLGLVCFRVVIRRRVEVCLELVWVFSSYLVFKYSENLF